MSGTIRSRMEEQRDRHESDHARAGGLPIREYCRHCDHVYPCPDRVAADDTLTDLNNAESDVFGHSIGLVRLVPDPTRSIWPFHPGDPPQPWTDEIPDPDSRGAE